MSAAFFFSTPSFRYKIIDGKNDLAFPLKENSVHLKTDDNKINQLLKSELGRLFAREIATLTREEAGEARWALHAVKSQRGLPPFGEALSDLERACIQKVNGRGESPRQVERPLRRRPLRYPLGC